MLDGLKLYEKLLRLGSDWSVTLVEVNDEHDEVHVFIKYNKEVGVCPDTGEICKVFDHREERKWRHLDSMEHTTWIHCRLPRIKNSFGAIYTIPVSWAEGGISHTRKFENKCIAALQATHNQSSAAVLMKISDDRLCGIMHKAVERGMEKRDLSKDTVNELSIDEKSFGKGHSYISVLSDPQKGCVLDVVQHRDEKAATALLHKVFSIEQLLSIKTVCCDMWEPFENAFKKTAVMQLWYMISFM